MGKYESKEVSIRKPAAEIYDMFNKLDALNPLVQDSIQGWQATEDTCTFMAKGFPVNLRVVERVPAKYLKIVTEGKTPFDATLETSLEENGNGETGMRIVLSIELNMMLKMMVGDRLQQGVNNVAVIIADYFNSGSK